MALIYDREKAVAYAHQWAYKRNPRYLDFENLGGDCTNFVSQSIYAGTGVMNYTHLYGWYYIDGNRKSPSWTGVMYLYNFLSGNKGIGPFAKEVPIENIEAGDVTQLSFDGVRFAHSQIVVFAPKEPNVRNVLVATHSFDSDNRPLDSYDYAKLRCLHILGYRK